MNPYDPRRHSYQQAHEPLYPNLRPQDLVHPHQNQYQPPVIPGYAAHGQHYAPLQQHQPATHYVPMAPAQNPYEVVPLLSRQEVQAAIAVNEDEHDRKQIIMEKIKTLEKTLKGGCYRFYYVILYLLLIANAVLLFVRVRRSRKSFRQIIPAAFLALLALFQAIKSIGAIRNLDNKKMVSAIRFGVTYMFLTFAFAVYCFGQASVFRVKEELCNSESSSSSGSHHGGYSDCDSYWYRSRRFQRHGMVCMAVALIAFFFYFVFANIVRRRLAKIAELKRQIAN